MKSALPLLACALVLACTTQAPTPNPSIPGTTPAPTGTPTAPPSPTLGATDDRGFPTSILGLTVHTVADMHSLAAAGRLDGRFMAVAGYWAQWAIPCPYKPHRAILDGFCTGGAFADDPATVSEFGGDINSTGVPLAVPETANGNMLWALGPGGPLGAAGSGSVVLIVHGADSRAGQCEAFIRAECQSRLVIDQVAWANGLALTLEFVRDTPAVAPTLAMDQVIAATALEGEPLVTAYPLLATDLNDVDPRLLGQGEGIVWFTRVISGAPDADGIADGKVVLVSDATGLVVTALPLDLDPDYEPARLVLDTNGPIPGPDGDAHFAVTLDDHDFAQGRLDLSSTPLALPPGDYEVHAWASTGAITSPPTAPDCDLTISLGAGDDVAYYADWPRGGDCVWNEGEWPFN